MSDLDYQNIVLTVEKSHFSILYNVSVCIKTTSCFGISLSEQDSIADSRGQDGLILIQMKICQICCEKKVLTPKYLHLHTRNNQFGK